MAIIVSDIHGDINKARAFLAHEPGAEHIVLGDLCDNSNIGITLDDELACLDLLFASDAVLLWGNHDLAYTLEQPWRCNTWHALPSEDKIQQYIERSEYLRRVYNEFGDVFVRDILSERFVKNRHRMRVAYVVDGWLCTHAGISPILADIIPGAIITDGQSAIANWLNEEFLRELQVPVPLTWEGPQRYGYGPLFQIPTCRWGTDRYGGIFWFDPHGEMVDPSPLVGRQIFGHTPVPFPERSELWVNVNNFEPGMWVFDTVLDELVEISNQGKIIR